ncbi:MAG: DUF1566 domain-containing protein [Bacteroidales bacterium]|nr:DUF1566 domain-containing protein [Bacteroidales bacterium]
MCLVSCQQDKVKLHEAVGTVYIPEGIKPTSSMAGDGIVFYVDEDAKYALVCSMNDLKYDNTPTNIKTAVWEKNFTWSVFGSDTVMERDTVWCKINRSFCYFIGKEDSVSTVSGRTEHFLKYNFEERDSMEVTIYPMLRYKAYTEKGVQVCPPYTEPQAYNGFIGELIPADSVLRRIDTTWKVLYDSIKRVVDTVIEKDTTWRNDTINRRDTIVGIDSLYHVMAARYSDTIWNHIKKGDRNYPSVNKWDYELDTNWSYSLIPGLGENDQDGKVNTQKIVNADVPCRQKIEPDSSSAARTCYTYYTNNYYPNRDQYRADTLYKATGQGEWYLPSREELKKLFDAKAKINDANVNTKGFEPLENCYWSSNQRDAKNAWYKCFSDNGVESYIPKANNNYRVGVRAVRKVKWPLK